MMSHKPYSNIYQNIHLFFAFIFLPGAVIAATSELSEPIVGTAPVAKGVKIKSVDENVLVTGESYPYLTYTFSDADEDAESDSSFIWQYKKKGTNTWADIGTKQSYEGWLPSEYQGGTLKACVTPKTDERYTTPHLGVLTCVEKKVSDTLFTSEKLYVTSSSIYPEKNPVVMFDELGRTDQLCPATGPDPINNPNYCLRYFYLDNADSEIGPISLTLYRTTGSVRAHYDVKLGDDGEWNRATLTPNSGKGSAKSFLLKEKVTMGRQKIWLRTANEEANFNYKGTTINIIATIY